MDLLVGKQGAGFPFEDALQVRLDVIIAAHGEIVAKVGDGADGGEMVVGAEGGRGLMAQDAGEQRFLHFARMLGRLLERGKAAPHRVGDELEDHIAQKPLQHRSL